MKNKLGQEEMVGFALIVIIVAVILVVFLGFSLKNEQENIESYEVDSFIQSFLQYTTDCNDNFEYLSIQDLIFECGDNEICLDERETCEVLNSTLKGITEESWKIQGGSQVKGYELKIVSNEKEIVLIKEGNETKNSKGSSQDFYKAGNSVEILFTVYS